MDKEKAIVIKRLPNFEVLHTFKGDNSRKKAIIKMNELIEEEIKKSQEDENYELFDHDYDFIHGEEGFINHFILTANSN